MWSAFKSVTRACEIEQHYCSFYKLQYTYCQVNKCHSETFKHFTLIHTNTSLVTHILVNLCCESCAKCYVKEIYGSQDKHVPIKLFEMFDSS